MAVMGFSVAVAIAPVGGEGLGFSASALRAANFGVAELAGAGYTITKEVGYTAKCGHGHHLELLATAARSAALAVRRGQNEGSLLIDSLRSVRWCRSSCEKLLGFIPQCSSQLMPFSDLRTHRWQYFGDI